MTEPTGGPEKRGKHRRTARQPIVPVGGGVPVDAETGERYGYLPRRAAQRKILIRSQLGLPWLLAALAFAGTILVAGSAYLLMRPGTPGPPYVDHGPLSRYADGAVTSLPDGSGWLDRRGGLSAVAGPVSYCPADGGWVDAAGTRYDAQGRRAGSGTGSGLARLPIRAAGGRLYVDPTRPQRPTAPAPAMTPCALPQAPGEPPPPDGL